jgi:hypothetical protein
MASVLEKQGALQGAPPCQPPKMPVISRHLKGVHLTAGSTWTGVRLPPSPLKQLSKMPVSPVFSGFFCAVNRRQNKAFSP